MIAKKIALIITSMILTGGMLITACAVYDCNNTKLIDENEPAASVSVSSAAQVIIETVVEAIEEVI